MSLLRSGNSYRQCRQCTPTQFPSFSRLPPEIRDMIWGMALPSRRFITNRHMSDRPHREPALLRVNREARAKALMHYTMRSIYTTYHHPHAIREFHINFEVDAFAYDTVDPRRALCISDDIFADDTPAQESYQREITDRVCKVVINLRELNVHSFEQKLCGTGFCEGLLPSLQEMIFFVPDARTRGAAKRKLRERRLWEHKLLEEEFFCKIKTSFDKWVGECQHCKKHNRERSVVNKPLKLTFATSPGGEFPAELVPVEEYPNGKYQTPADWCL